MPIAILDPFSGIAGDMLLGALIAVGLDSDWLRALPSALGLGDVEVGIREVIRGEIVCQKVDFDIPSQPHGRHIRQILELVAGSDAPERVRVLADKAFWAIASAEGEIHGVSPETVHLHEVGAVDAILDVVGVIWGFELLGIEHTYCGTIALGDGTVKAAHGLLPVPAPATLKLLEGHPVRPGPSGSGELVTPTGAALVRVLSSSPAPERYVPRRSGFGAGTKDFVGRANALRLILADELPEAERGENLVELVCDVDDMSAEYLAAATDRIRSAGALDVTSYAVIMKHARPGTRIEVLARASDVERLEELLLIETTTIGVRRRTVIRRALPRETLTVSVLGHNVTAKLVRLPNGRRRAKPEFSDLQRVALATGRPLQDISRLAVIAVERHLDTYCREPGHAPAS